MISFEPLFDTMKKRGETWYTLENNYNISSNTLQRLKNNANTTIETIDLLCEILDCDLMDIVVRVPNNKPINRND